MADLFVNYSSLDREAVEGVVAELTRRDISVFWARSDLLVGKRWPKKLVKEINSCRSFVAFLGLGNLSDWQEREIELAILRDERDPNFRIVPVFLARRADLPITLISSYHGIEVRGDLRAEEVADELVAMLREFASLGD